MKPAVVTVKCAVEAAYGSEKILFHCVSCEVQAPTSVPKRSPTIELSQASSRQQHSIAE